MTGSRRRRRVSALGRWRRAGATVTNIWASQRSATGSWHLVKPSGTLSTGGASREPAANKYDVLNGDPTGFRHTDEDGPRLNPRSEGGHDPHKMQCAKLLGSLSDHVALAHKDLVRRVRQPSPDTHVEPAHDDRSTPLTNTGLLDPNHLNDRRLTHVTATLADTTRRAPDSAQAHKTRRAGETRATNQRLFASL